MIKRVSLVRKTLVRSRTKLKSGLECLNFSRAVLHTNNAGSDVLLCKLAELMRTHLGVNSRISGATVSPLPVPLNKIYPFIEENNNSRFTHQPYRIDQRRTLSRLHWKVLRRVNSQRLTRRAYHSVRAKVYILIKHRMSFDLTR
jgi:hypothetical protein